MAQMYSYTTMTLLDAMKVKPDLLDNLEMNTQERTQAFKETFTSMYNTKSIGAETIELFQVWVENRFNELKRLYNSKLDIYEMNLNGDDGIKIIRETYGSNSNTYNGSNNSTTTDTINDTQTNIDLPRNATNTEYPTSKVKNDGTDTRQIYGASESTDSGSRSETQTIKGDVNVIDQRNKWLNFIRDLYREMCQEFKDCFAIIYY